MISYGSAIAATPMRCRRFLDDAPPGSSARVCGLPVAGGAGLGHSYCQGCRAALTAPRRYQPRVPRVPRGPIADPWVLPTEDEMAEIEGVFSCSGDAPRPLPNGECERDGPWPPLPPRRRRRGGGGPCSRGYGHGALGAAPGAARAATPAAM